MNLQWLTGNPKRGKRVKKKLASKKKGPKLKTMAKSKRLKKNPITITRTKNGKTKLIGEVMTANEIKAVREAAKRYAKKAGKKAAGKKFKLIGRLAKKDTAKIFKLKKHAAASKIPGSGVKMVERDDISGVLRKHGLLKKGKQSKAAKSKAKSSALKRKILANLKKSKQARLASKHSKNKLISGRDSVENLKKLKAAGFASGFSEKEKTVAKRKKRKSSKKSAKRKSVKKYSKRKSRKVRKSSKRRIKRSSKKRASKRKVVRRKIRRSKKARRSSGKGRFIKSVKSVRLYPVKKSGKSGKIRTIKRPKGGKLSMFVKNPIGGAMKALDKVNVQLEKALGHSLQQSGVLFAAGAVVGSVESLVVGGIQKLNLPIPVSLQKYVPTIGTLTLAGVGHYFASKKLGKNHIAADALKALIAATIVKAGDQIAGSQVKSALGMSGITRGDFDYSYQQTRADFGEVPRVMNGVLATPMGEVPRLSRPMGVVPQMNGVLATPMNGVLATPMGSYATNSTQSTADFGAIDHDHEVGDYEDSDQENMSGLS